MISNDKLCKKYEGMSAKELLKAPVSALQGVSAADGDKLKEAFGIDNIKEMANLNFYRRAKEIAAEAEKE